MNLVKIATLEPTIASNFGGSLPFFSPNKKTYGIILTKLFCLTGTRPVPCARPPYTKGPRRVLRAVTRHILTHFSLISSRAQTEGVLRAVTCQNRGACAREGEVTRVKGWMGGTHGFFSNIYFLQGPSPISFLFSLYASIQFPAISNPLFFGLINRSPS